MGCTWTGVAPPPPCCQLAPALSRRLRCHPLPSLTLILILILDTGQAPPPAPSPAGSSVSTATLRRRGTSSFFFNSSLPAPPPALLIRHLPPPWRAVPPRPTSPLSRPTDRQSRSPPTDLYRSGCLGPDNPKPQQPRNPNPAAGGAPPDRQWAFCDALDRQSRRRLRTLAHQLSLSSIIQG
jgi:hypothetical protein